ncbi:uncharacterized protein EI90DRAFT_3060516 [Cantharellus anzutake]|uniref:uncharacterized protein n=1 Tax=Cantharellus anzutake TaxID=1750568 RepID=UPI001903448A|nr:uncharacterized protein EI90DRAFT_3060516 [Cantharellus anzutake]KAF8330374.1 hypothetical protein EI90DRAFT_3060516 [Cantharellus anzutake]
MLCRQNEEISHQLSGLPPPPPPLVSSMTSSPHGGVTTNIPPPPPSSLPTAIPNIGLRVTPSANLPVPIAGTGPPGQQRHSHSQSPYVSYTVPPYHPQSGPPLSTNTQLVPPGDQAPIAVPGQQTDQQAPQPQLQPGPQEQHPSTPVPISMPMQMPDPALGMHTPGQNGFTQENSAANGNGQTARPESMNSSGGQATQAENGGLSESGLFS